MRGAAQIAREQSLKPWEPGAVFTAKQASDAIQRMLGDYMRKDAQGKGSCRRCCRENVRLSRSGYCSRSCELGLVGMDMPQRGWW